MPQVLIPAIADQQRDKSETGSAEFNTSDKAQEYEEIFEAFGKECCKLSEDDLTKAVPLLKWFKKKNRQYG